jgi:hypothetical protein
MDWNRPQTEAASRSASYDQRTLLSDLVANVVWRLEAAKSTLTYIEVVLEDCLSQIDSMCVEQMDASGCLVDLWSSDDSSVGKASSVGSRERMV